MNKKKIATIITAIAAGTGMIAALVAIVGEVFGFRYKVVTEIGADGVSRNIIRRRWPREH